MTRSEITSRQEGILADFLAGRSNRQIAAAHGVHRSYPPILARRFGVPLKRPPAEPVLPWPKPYRTPEAAE